MMLKQSTPLRRGLSHGCFRNDLPFSADPLTFPFTITIFLASSQSSMSPRVTTRTLYKSLSSLTTTSRTRTTYHTATRSYHQSTPTMATANGITKEDIEQKAQSYSSPNAKPTNWDTPGPSAFDFRSTLPPLPPLPPYQLTLPLQATQSPPPQPPCSPP